jgi:hypothetical protein
MKYYYYFRYFLGFIYDVFSVLNDKHPFYEVNDDSKNDNKCYNLQSTKIKRQVIDRLWYIKYNKNKFCDGLNLDANGKKLWRSNPAVLKNAFKMLKKHMYPNQFDTKQDIAGDPMDIAILSALFNINIIIMAAYTQESIDETF